MASFKDNLIKDLKAESASKHQILTPSLELKGDQIIPDVREEAFEEVEDILNIDEVEIPECEKFENLFLIDTILGESVPLKIIASKMMEGVWMWQQPAGLLSLCRSRGGLVWL